MQTTSNVVSAMAGEVARNIEVYDLALQEVTEAVQDPAVAALPKAALGSKAPACRLLFSIGRCGSSMQEESSNRCIVDKNAIPAVAMGGSTAIIGFAAWPFMSTVSTISRDVASQRS
ncbi:protein of unknown function (plasmid) [Caballeronia sp. S22]